MIGYTLVQRFFISSTVIVLYLAGAKTGTSSVSFILCVVCGYVGFNGTKKGDSLRLSGVS